MKGRCKVCSKNREVDEALNTCRRCGETVDMLMPQMVAAAVAGITAHTGRAIDYEDLAGDACDAAEAAVVELLIRSEIRRAENDPNERFERYER